MKKKLSIVIPVYNVEKFLKRCLDSIIKQNEDNIEIILVDDGSTDSSAKICDDYSKKYNFIKIYHKKNGGASSARNYGIEYTIGEYIWFIDSDDKIEKQSLKNIINIIEKNDFDVIVCNSKKVFEDGTIKDECKYSIKTGAYTSEDFMKALKKNPESVIFAPQYYIVKKEFLIKNKIYFYEGIIHEDELWIPQLLIFANSIYYSNLNIYYHYMWNGSVMHSTKIEKSGISCLTVANELFKIYDNSNRQDLQFLRDKAANIFLQAIWKIPNFMKNKENIKRTLPIKNSLYFKTKIKAILYFLSPKFYLFIHSKKQSNPKTVGIVTIIDSGNFGNRLQNYALSYYCNNVLKVDTYTLINHDYLNNRKLLILRICKHMLRKIKIDKRNKKDIDKFRNFMLFDKNIKYYDKVINAYSKFNKFKYLIVGSDQVWNPNFRRLRDVDVLKYANNSKRISYAVSFGVENIEKKYDNRIINDISKFDSLSVREDSGKRIIQNKIDADVKVVIDPTMLLSSADWDKVAKSPIKVPNKKYILCYFLGENNGKRKDEINRIAEENNYEIVDILNRDGKYFSCGPSEFIWLIKNASLVCTDSFHASVFSILYDVSFIVFDREQKKMKNMNSRINTLLSKFKLESRKFNGKQIKNKQLLHDYSTSYKILEEEKEISNKFLKKALDIE